MVFPEENFLLPVVPNTDPDPGQPYEYGSMRIRIHKLTKTEPLVILRICDILLDPHALA
jgi:hypothetical protein